MEITQMFQASNRIKDLIYRTPLMPFNSLTKMTGNQVYLKLENAQKTGSFKIRGAGNKIAMLAESGNKPELIVAASAGNHAQGVAYAAFKYKIKACIVMPTTAPIAKQKATQGYGAEVVLHGNTFDEAYAYSQELVKSKSNAVYLHPFDDEDVIAGQGTIGLEILQELPDIDVIIAPIGGGGLMSGISFVAKKINPNIKVIGVQASNADAAKRCFEAHQIIDCSILPSIADGINVKRPGAKTMELICKYVDQVVTVTEEQIEDAIAFLLARKKQMAEGSGAASLAYALYGDHGFENKKIACVISGGNIDLSKVCKLLSRM